MSITIKDVARKTGVSIATVSRIVNNQSGYSEQTRKKVIMAIEDLGYSPNALARGLVGQATRTVGVLLPNVSSLFAGKLLEGIEAAAQSEGYSIVVCNTGSEGERTDDYLTILKQKRVEGILYASGDFPKDLGEKIDGLGLPVVTVATRSHEETIPYVKVDDQTAAFDGTSCLIEKGHRSIAFLGGGLSDPVAGKPRFDGYLDALKAHGIPRQDSLVRFGDFRFESGKRETGRLLDEGAAFTALFASSDEMAVGALHAARERGVRVPEELSVLGYDNTLAAEMALPPLTTVEQPLHAMGEQAFRTLINGGGSLTAKHAIIERQTVRQIEEE
ncbi:LacI family DNA-binding transcriptional regulator [Alteribacter natronophilus]|uniref:LacI family DNA-binding transcriptional regulator n=1 Tax=Alteribacter natronophilus TaxID=2583810 RepID=UPI00110D3591|nr:LacI family DNA-binding transcriptional regulator [Alteribacter natronophilus]TMW73931.1 LacI family transcriptional regulator [Alteribacter natronophilus]